MNKLFWIVCEDKNTTLYEGRFQGRTRTAAIKFLKATLGVKSLKGLVFTVTEIPVPILREIIAELLGIPLEEVGRTGSSKATGTSPDDHGLQSNLSTRSGSVATPVDPEVPPGSYGQIHNAKPAPAIRNKTHRKVGNPGLGDEFWAEVQAYWRECRGIKQTAIKFKLSQNSVKTRARREGWRNSNPPV